MDVQQILKEEHEKALAKRQGVADDLAELYEDFRQFSSAVDLSDKETLAAMCFVIFAFADGYAMVVQAGDTTPEQAEPLLRQTVANELEEMLSELKESRRRRSAIGCAAARNSRRRMDQPGRRRRIADCGRARVFRYVGHGIQRSVSATNYPGQSFAVPFHARAKSNR